MDAVVLGTSVAGIAAALTLAEAGHRVSLLPHNEDGSLPDVRSIVGTPLFNSSLPGWLYERRALEILAAANVKILWSDSKTFMIPSRLDHGTSGIKIIDEFSGIEIIFDVAIFAPVGAEEGLPDSTGWRSFVNRGLSYSAASDGVFFKNKHTAVCGNGFHSVEQAAMLFDKCTSVTLILEVDAGHLDIRAQEALRELPLNVVYSAQIVRIEGDDSGWIRSILIEEEGRIRTVVANGLFLAHEPRVKWGVLGSENRAASMVDIKRLYLAGIAAGIDYSDYSSLYADGVSKAEACCGLRPR